MNPWVVVYRTLVSLTKLAPQEPQAQYRKYQVLVRKQACLKASVLIYGVSEFNLNWLEGVVDKEWSNSSQIIAMSCIQKVGKDQASKECFSKAQDNFFVNIRIIDCQIRQYRKWCDSILKTLTAQEEERKSSWFIFLCILMGPKKQQFTMDAIFFAF